MKKLFYVPVIHSVADMGSVGGILSETSAAALGKDLWKDHLETVSLFWKSVSDYFASLRNADFKIYQDGLVAAGEAGLKIVAEGTNQGSANYAIISGLLRRGATLVQTEDIALVQKEYSYLKLFSKARSAREKEAILNKYRLAQSQLLIDRDRYISRTIESTLKEDEKGLLFLGAFHEVLSKLPADITVVQVKDIKKVREYQKLLKSNAPSSIFQIRQLAEYLSSAVPEETAEL
ncbi:MAG: hypothetical protein JXA46_16295 [Dehalococcoidales bacterium]|nr:hypothetical protein [Dehalococcoidales bacterium]